MPKKIAYLASKFAKIIYSQQSKEVLESFEQGSQYVFLPNTATNALAGLVEMLNTRGVSISEIEAARKLMMQDRQETSRGANVALSRINPLLQALTVAWKALEKTNASPVDIEAIDRVYDYMSDLKSATEPVSDGQASAPKAPVYVVNPKVKQVQEILNDLDCPYPLNPDGKLGPQTRLALKWFRNYHLGLKLLSDADTMNAVLQSSNQAEPLAAPADKSSTWGNSKELPPPLPAPSASQLARRFSKIITATESRTKLANRFLQVIASDESTTFVVNIETQQNWWEKPAGPTQISRLAVLSFVHQLRVSPYHSMIKYVHERPDDSILLNFKEPVSKDMVLKICHSLPLSFSHDPFEGTESEGGDFVVSNIGVKSYSVFPIKEALSFVIETNSPEDASALADELTRFARIASAQAEDNVIQVTFTESANVELLRSMCKKVSRLFLRIDADKLIITEAADRAKLANFFVMRQLASFLQVLADGPDGYAAESNFGGKKSPAEVAAELAANRKALEYLNKHPTPSTNPADAQMEKELGGSPGQSTFDLHDPRGDARRYLEKSLHPQQEVVKPLPDQKSVWNVSKQKWITQPKTFAWNRLPIRSIIRVLESGKVSFYRKTGPEVWAWMNEDQVPQEGSL